LEHGNFDLPGRLDRVAQRLLITPALHRAHHTRDWRDLDTNFGTILSVWDRLAGTFHAGVPERRVVTGLPNWSRLEGPTPPEAPLLPLPRGPRPASVPLRLPRP